MISEAAATYLPDYQVIKFKSAFQPFADPENLRGFETPQESGFFIHEWLHFLHNISTYHGIVAYSHTVLLWSNVRTYVYDSPTAPDPQHFNNIHRQLNYRLNARSPKANRIPHNTPSSSVKLLSYSLRSWSIDDDINYKCTEIVCDTVIDGKEHIETLIGCHEIVESVAFLLEERYLIKNKELASANVYPYHLVSKLASFIAPDLAAETVLKCGILSLQHLDPPEWLPKLLERAQIASEQGIDPDQLIIKAALEHLKLNADAIARNIDFIDSLFPADEPVARAVKYATKKMRENLDHRLSDPFFEISLVDTFASEGAAALFHSLEKYGTGFLVQERAGESDKPQKDLMYDISLADQLDPELSAGRRMAQASFLYTFSFLKLDPKEIKHPDALICPFYTSCTNTLRMGSSDTCKKRPWISQYLHLNNMCFFGRAVLNTIGCARTND